MVIHGADTSAVADVEQRIGAYIERLQAVLASDHGFVSGLRECWHGADAEEFLGTWQGQDRPAIEAVVAALVTMREELRSNRLAQEETSSALRSVTGSPSIENPRISDRLDDIDARREVLSGAKRYMANATGLRRDLPGVSERLDKWLAELDPDTATVGEVAAFERYLAAAQAAFIQQGVVRDAAEFGMGQFIEAAESGGAAIGGLGSLQDPAAFADVFLDGIYDVTLDQIGGASVDGVVNAANLSELAGEAAVQRYVRDVDGLLAAMESEFRANERVGHVDPFDLMMLQNDVYNSELSQAIVHSEFADAFDILTGDGSITDGVLRGGLRIGGDALTGGLMSKALDGMEIVGNSAQAKYHIEAGSQAMVLAGSGHDRVIAMTNMVN